MPATLKDVAKLAGVDISSVSRTLADHPRAMSLRLETRERILNAAQKLGYRRNVFAAAMRSGKNRIVAIINSGHPEISRSVSSLRVMAGILEGASESGYALKTYSTTDLKAIFDDIIANQIKLVICLEPDHIRRSGIADLCRRNNIKLVFTYETAVEEFPSFATDNFSISKQVVKFLADCGHKKIALVCGEYQKWAYMTEKYNGYLAGLRESGIEPEFNLIISEEVPDDAIRNMLMRSPSTLPSAMFCISDGFAMRAMRYAIQMKMQLPQELSLIGFGVTTSSEDALLPLSSIDENQAISGLEAFRFLVKNQTSYPCDKDGTYRIPAKFINRSSVFEYTPPKKRSK